MPDATAPSLHDRPTPPAFRLRSTLLLAALGTALLAGCGQEPNADPLPLPPGVLLEGGGITIHRDEFERIDDYLTSHDPTLGRRYRAREILDQCLIPIALARRDFGTERAALREQAEALRDGCDNSLELRRRGALAGGGETPEPVPANELPMTAREFAFHPENLGAVSPVIETPDGFLLIAPLDLVAAVTTARDAVHAYVVRFDMAAPPPDWLQEARRSLREAPKQIHPDLDGALPRWLSSSP